jgi:superfamily II DNA or RNA helicase
VIIASKVFKKGISINRLDLIIDAAGRKNREDAVQKFGRGVRRHKHKRGLIYLDISDTDYRDKERDEKNPLAKAARRRKKALKAAGINIHTYQWNHKSSATHLLRKAERWLKKELNTENHPSS